ncbi:MAG TPA: nucleotidyltransferase domain-containing protein [Gaiellaceae bacterium]|nr:nucleotidyltransferase domain-containing protein [Gaiellaceae bacterium]
MLRWPRREVVRAAVDAWAAGAAAQQGVVSVGCFGSLARGTWGVGSDVDLIVVVEHSSEPSYRRSLAFDASTLPVPADVVVYTRQEWDRLSAAGREPLGPVEWIEPVQQAGSEPPR